MIQTSQLLIEITPEVLDLPKLYDFVISKASGAADIFIGTVRDEFEGKAVKGIEYHGYPEMGEKVLHSICDAALAEWKINKIAVQHRTGYLNLTEASVVIAVGAAHRHEAFTACRFIIEEIKIKLPIWKKEFFADGSVDWKYDLKKS